MTQLLTAEHMFIADPTVYTVEKLLRKRKRQGSYEYLVKWRDYNFRFNTWEPESNILDQRLVAEFEERGLDELGPYKELDLVSGQMSHSDTENNENLANTSPKGSSSPSRPGPGRRPKRKRPDRSYVKLRKRGKRVPATPVKYEEIENEIEERLSDDEEDAEEEKAEEEEASEEEEEEERYLSSPSNVRNLRNKAKPSLNVKKRSAVSKKFSDLMRRSRKQAQTYGMQFSRSCSSTQLPVVETKEEEKEEDEEEARQALVSEEEEDDEDDEDKPERRAYFRHDRLSTQEKEELKDRVKERQKMKRAAKFAAMTAEELEVEREKARERMRVYRERLKTAQGASGEEEELVNVTGKRKRPVRSCAVPTGFWDPVVTAIKPTGDSGIDSDGESLEYIKAKQISKNFEPAPSSFYNCSSNTETCEAGDINDLGASVFPKKKFTLKPPTLDISKKPISEFVFKIDDLWADKVYESSVEALGYRVKVYECKSSKPLFTKRRKEDKPRLGT